MNRAVTTEHQQTGSPNPRATRWEQLLSAEEPCPPHSLRSASLTGKRVLITGAGGSIGSALAHAAAASEPSSLILFDNSENGLYQVDRSLRDSGSREHFSLLGDVRSAESIEQAMSEQRPQIIFHAAALKQVPLMEQNPFAAIGTNVFGSLALLEAADAHGTEQVVLVSTDKAVDPCSIMGASKRIAELLFLSSHTSTRRSVVRLCNVMGSRGSVLPLFLEQIAKGGPVTVTHPEVQRYFLTLHETVLALLHALSASSSNALLLPEVGAPIRIVDLARHLIEVRQSSATIAFTGLRPGDKLVEQLMSSRESPGLRTATDSSGLCTIETPSVSAAELGSALRSLEEAIQRCDLPLLLSGIWSVVPEYTPSSVVTAALRAVPSLETAAEMQV